MSNFIPLSVPNLAGNELKYVTEAVSAQWVSTGGALINKLEEDMAKYLNVEKVTALQSGTAGLHLSMILSGVGYGDEVIVPTLTFIAGINHVKYVGAEPIFMDCDDYLCIDIKKVQEFCENECDFLDGKLINKKTAKHIKAIVAVHVFGNMADMENLMPLAQKYNIKVIEDATEALGTYYKNGKYEKKFAGTIGDFGVYSFNGNKIITTGGGGALVAKDLKMVEKAKYLSTQAKDDDVNFVHNEIGYNYRMTNLQAALGVAQFEQLEDFIKIKERNFELYKNEGLNLLDFDSALRSNKWFYSLLTDKRDEMIDFLSKNQIQTRPIWKLIHTLMPYQNCQAYKIEKAIEYQEKVVNIPCSTNLTEDDVLRVVEKIKEFTNG